MGGIPDFELASRAAREKGSTQNTSGPAIFALLRRLLRGERAGADGQREQRA